MANKNYLFRYTPNLKEKIMGETKLDRVQPFSRDDRITVMVWNIYKQQRLNWLPVLQEYGKDRDLLLLQEARSSDELLTFSGRHFHVADQVPAIELPNHSFGVMTLASAYPIYTRPFRKAEPLLRLPKSALVNIYPLYDGRLLMVVNVHAVNFSLGVSIYKEQIRTIAEHVMRHQGPVIFAGDFNTWSRQRLYMLYTFTRRMGLRPVTFKEDLRKSAFSYPLDFIFYRELEVETSRVIETDASDHNPMLVDFIL